MLKKIVILPLLLFTATVLQIACNHCDYQAANKYVIIEKGKVSAMVNNMAIVESSNVNNDTITFYNNSIEKCVTKSSPKWNLFTAAYAYDPKCAACGSKGLKYAFANLKITATSSFNGIAAGQSLNNFFKIAHYVYTNTYSNGNKIYLPVQQYLDSIRINPTYIAGKISYLEAVATKPTILFNGKVKFSLIFTNADTVVNETVNFTWQ